MVDRREEHYEIVLKHQRPDGEHRYLFYHFWQARVLNPGDRPPLSTWVPRCQGLFACILAWQEATA